MLNYQRVMIMIIIQSFIIINYHYCPRHCCYYYYCQISGCSGNWIDRCKVEPRFQSGPVPFGNQTVGNRPWAIPELNVGLVRWENSLNSMRDCPASHVWLEGKPSHYQSVDFRSHLNPTICMYIYMYIIYNIYIYMCVCITHIYNTHIL
jgi:hypothetical protein